MEPKRILIVDDSAVERERLQRLLLSRGGCEVISAAQGTEALTLLERRRFDIILMDIIMPGEWGTKILSQIREQYNQVELPIIMVTSLEAVTPIVACLKLGANDYLTKPVNIDIAWSRIQTHLQLAELQSEKSRSRLLTKVS